MTRTTVLLVMGALVTLGCSSAATPSPADDDAGYYYYVKGDAGADGAPRIAYAADAADAATKCDTVTQDCSDPAQLRCTVVDGLPTYKATCVAATGTKKDGEACTMNLASGDDCAAGSYCTMVGVGPNAPVCAKLCHVDADCAAGKECVNIQYPGSHADFYDGVCIDSCAPFTTACGAGRSCAWSLLTPIGKPTAVCKTDGRGDAGAACDWDDDCATNLSCYSDHRCVAQCDAAHPCAGIATCKGGFCL